MMIGGIGGDAKSEKEWEAEHDLETLIRAEKIKADPKRVKAAMAIKRKLKKALDKVEG